MAVSNLMCCTVMLCFVSLWHVSSSQKEDYKLVEALSDATKYNDVADMGCRPIKDTPEVKNSNRMSLTWCAKQCWRLGKKYALVSHGTVCQCENAILGPPMSRICNIICPNAKAQMCGGVKQANVLLTGYVPILWEQVIKMYNSTQIYKEKRKAKRTDEMAKHDGSCSRFKLTRDVFYFKTIILTKELCVVHCFHYKYVYALLSKGEFCHCTSTSPTGELTGQCNNHCYGDSRETCGGKIGVHTVWLTGHYETRDFMSRVAFKPTLGLQQNWKNYYHKHPSVFQEINNVRDEKLLGPLVTTIGNVDEVLEVKKGLSKSNIAMIGGVLGAVPFLILIGLAVKCFTKRLTPVIDAESEKDAILEKSEIRMSPSERMLLKNNIMDTNVLDEIRELRKSSSELMKLMANKSDEDQREDNKARRNSSLEKIKKSNKTSDED